MDLKYKNVASLFTCLLVMLLGLSLLAPLYHNHSHDGDRHADSDFEHEIFHDGKEYDGFSSDHEHDGFHLHFRKAVSSCALRLQTKERYHNPEMSDEPASSFFLKPVICCSAGHDEEPALLSISYGFSFGLSPPAV